MIHKPNTNTNQIVDEMENKIDEKMKKKRLYSAILFLCSFNKQNLLKADFFLLVMKFPRENWKIARQAKGFS